MSGYHGAVKAADVLEVLFGDGEHAASHHGCLGWLVRMLASEALTLGERVPAELHVPVEAADAEHLVDVVLVLEGLLVDEVDHGRGDGRLALSDLVE